MVSSIVGFIGPGGATSLFAVSVDHDLLGGDLIWLVLIVIAVFGVVATFMIKQPKPAISI